MPSIDNSSSNWAEPDEIIKTLTPFSECSGNAGPALYFYQGTPYVLTRNANMLVLGSTGTGKSESIIKWYIRSVLDQGQSFLVTDIKGEHYQTFSRSIDRSKYDVRVFDFIHPNSSDRYCQLSYAYECAKSKDPSLWDLSDEIIHNTSHSYLTVSDKDPFWSLAGINIVQSCILILNKLAPKEAVNFASVVKLISDDIAHRGFDFRNFLDREPADSMIKSMLSSYAYNTASETRSGMASSALDFLLPYTTYGMKQITCCGDDLKLEEIQGDKPLAIFIMLPDTTSKYDILAGNLIFDLTNHMIHLAQDKYSGRLPIRFHLILEECGNITGALSNLPKIMSAGRSRGISTALVLQSLNQLDRYGISDAKTILGNISAEVAFRTDMETQTALSYACGYRMIYPENDRIVPYRIPLITPEQLSMKTGEALVLLDGNDGRLKYTTELPCYEDYYGKPEPVELLQREPRQPALFDLNAYLHNIVFSSLHGTDNNPEVNGEPPVSLGEVSSDNKPVSGLSNEDIDKMIADIDRKLAELEMSDSAKLHPDEIEDSDLQKILDKILKDGDNE